MKTCKQCAAEKQIERFSSFTGANGRTYLRGSCKECRLRANTGLRRNWRAENYERNAMAHRAQESVARAIRNGSLVRPASCEECGQVSPRIHAAHRDYSRRLDVRWLCVSCHNRWDHAQPKSAALEAS